MKNIKDNILIMILLSIVIPAAAIFMVYMIVFMIGLASSLFSYWLTLAAVCSISSILICTINKNRFVTRGLLFCFGLVLMASGIILLIG